MDSCPAFVVAEAREDHYVHSRPANGSDVKMSVESVSEVEKTCLGQIVVARSVGKTSRLSLLHCSCSHSEI